MYCVWGQSTFTRCVKIVVAASLSAAFATQALAGAFGLREQSAYSQGASFAGEATCGDSIAGVFYNPAVVTCANGLELEGSLTGILPIIDVTTNPFPGSLFGAGSPLFNAGSPGDIGVAALVPAVSAAYEFNDKEFPVYHGFPLRVAAEGMQGNIWVKWLGEIVVQ